MNDLVSYNAKHNEAERNFLINPAHLDFSKIHIGPSSALKLDRRLFSP